MMNSRIIYSSIYFLIAFMANLQAQITVDAPVGCSPHLATFSVQGSFTAYSWQFGNGTQSTASSPTVIFDDAGTFSASVTVTNSNGQTQTFSNASAVTVSNSPDPDFNLPSDTICIGQPLIGNINAFNSNSVYQWTMGDGTSYSSNNISHNYQQSGTYQVQLTETNQTGCLALSPVQTVQVRSLPNSNFSLSTPKSCYDSIDIVATASLQTNSLLWKLNGNNVGSAGTHVYQNLPAGQHQAGLIATDAFGCTSQTNKTITQSFPPNLILWYDTLAGCAPLTVQTVVAPANGFQLLWSAGNNQISGDSAAFVFNQVGNHSIHLSITDNLNCAYEDSITGINVLTSIAPSIQLGTTTFCDQGWAAFEVNDTNIQAVEWSIYNNLVFNQHDSVYLTNPGTHDLSATFTMVNGCVIQSIIPDAFTIESAKPMVSLPPVTACNEANFSVQHNNPGILTPIWNIAGQSISAQSAGFYVDSVGTFDLVFIAQTPSGCTDTSVFYDYLTIDGDSHISNTGALYSSCDAFTFNGNGGLYGVEAFNWDFGDGGTSLDSHAVHTFVDVGVYSVALEAVDYKGCTIHVDTFAQIIIDELVPSYAFQLQNCAEAEVLFYSLTAGDSWIWEIDGDTFLDSSFVTPVNPYAPVNVKHVVTNSAGCTGMVLDINAVNVDTCAPIYIGDFPAPGQSNGSGNWYKAQPYVSACAPAIVGFEHPEDSVSLVIYDFGNGDTVHATQKIIHVFDTANYYDIDLTIVFDNGDTLLRSLDDYVRIGNPISKFSLDEELGCFGNQVSLMNESQHAQSWLTNFGDGTLSYLEHPVHTYNNAGTYTIKLTAKDTFQCKAISAQVVNALNNDFNASVPASVCVGDTFYISHNVTGYDSYSWQIGSATFIGKNPPFVIQDTGWLPIVLNAIDSSACATTYFNNLGIQVYSVEADFDLGFAQDQCFEVQHQLTASAPGNSNLSWYLDQVFVGNQSTFNLSVIDSGMHVIELSAWQYGCNTSFIDTFFVHQPTADFIPNNNGLCLPQNVSFNDLSSTAAQWTWDFGDGNTSNAQNPSHAFNFGHKDSISLTIVDAFGCVSEKTIAPIDFYEIDVDLDKFIYCSPATITVKDEVGEGQFYTWNLNGTTSTLGDSVAFILNDSGFLSLQLNVLFPSGCSSSIGLDSIAFISNPKADFEMAAITGDCAPKVVAFNDNSSPGVISYNWDFGNGMGSKLPDPTAVYTESGVYDVSLSIIDSLQCKDTIFYPDLVIINGPKALFSVDDPLQCEGERVFFTNESRESTSYLWIFGDGNTSTSRRASHLYADSGIYTVDLFAFDSLGCRDRYRFDGVNVQVKPDLNLKLVQNQQCIPAIFKIKDESEDLLNPRYWISFNQDRFEFLPDSSFQFNKPGDYYPLIEVRNSNGCKSVLEWKSLVEVFDTLAGPEPSLAALNVGNNQTEVGFIIHPVHNFKTLELFKLTNSQWQQIDESTDSSFVFRDELPPSDTSFCYKIGLKHHCVTDPDLDSLPVYCTINLKVEQNEDQRLLSWNSIGNIDFTGYDVQRRNGNDAFMTIAELNSSESSFIDSAKACPETHSYRVIANSINGFNHGQSDREWINIDTLPEFKQSFDITNVSVISDGVIAVEWDADLYKPSALIPYYSLRRTNDNLVFTEIPIVLQQGVFLDYNANTAENYYKYQIVPIDVCGINYTAGSVHSSIMLRMQQFGEGLELNWLRHESLDDGLESYELQYKDQFGEWRTIQKFDSIQHSIKLDLRDIDLNNQ